MLGLTGIIRFDNQGFRSNFLLDIVELNKDGLKKIGTWNSTEGVNFTRTYGEVYTQIVESLQNKTFVVTTILVSILCMLQTSFTGKMNKHIIIFFFHNWLYDSVI